MEAKNKGAIARSGAHDYDAVLANVVHLIEEARSAAVRSVNSVMTATYWAVGRRIVVAEQGGQRRAECGAALIERLAADLTARYGRGFGNADPKIVQAASAQLGRAIDTEKLQTTSAQSASLRREGQCCS